MTCWAPLFFVGRWLTTAAGRWGNCWVEKLHVKILEICRSEKMVVISLKTIRKDYFEKTRSRLESYSKWCDTYHSCNSTRQEWNSSITSDPCWALPQNPSPPLQPSRIRRASAISPVPWRWAVGVGSVQWVWGRNAESRDDKVHQSLFVKAKEYRWMYLEMELYGFEL